MVAIGPAKYGSTGGGAIYADVVVLSKSSNWILNQLTSEAVVVDGVTTEILNRNPSAAGSKAKRRIGHDFSRVGLLKFAFGAIFHTLEVEFPEILTGVKQTEGYYWLNAS